MPAESAATKMKGNQRLVGVGLLFLAAALSLALYNLYEDERAATASRQVLEEMAQQASAEAAAGQTPDTEEETAAADGLPDPYMEMPTLEIDGNAYIGTLEIPALELSLPILSEWSSAGLKIAPCRYTGSAYQGSLIIAGHNYRNHFGNLNRLAAGDEIVFTDVSGNAFYYTVSAMEQLSGTAVEEMQAGDWDLTLFTCTYSGEARVTVRCKQER